MRACTALFLLLTILLGGCVRVDPDQARICRTVLPALYPEGVRIGVLSVAAGEGAHRIRIIHEVQNGPSSPREVSAVCSFAGGRFSSERQDLAEVTLNGRAISGVRLHLIRRFWLPDPAVSLLTPAISEVELSDILQIPRSLAISMQHFLSAVPQTAIYALLASGYALIYGLIGRINLAYGELAIIGGQGALIGAIGGAVFFEGAPLAILVFSAVLAVTVSAIHGGAMARLVFLPLSRIGGQPLLVATAGMAIASTEYIRIAQGTSNRWSPPLLNTPVTLARSGDFLVTVTEGAALAAMLAFAVTLALLTYLGHSHFGRSWKAVADEPQAARLFGIDPDMILLRSFGIASLLAGLAGFIMSAHYGGIGFSGGLGIGLKALAAAILGGIGSVPGAFLGALLVGGFEALWAAFLPVHHRETAVFSLLVLLLVLRPGGLLGFADYLPRRV
jgi:branched-chain amino acid transport system permease protein